MTTFVSNTLSKIILFRDNTYLEALSMPDDGNGFFHAILHQLLVLDHLPRSIAREELEGSVHNMAHIAATSCVPQNMRKEVCTWLNEHYKELAKDCGTNGSALVGAIDRVVYPIRGTKVTVNQATTVLVDYFERMQESGAHVGELEMIAAASVYHIRIACHASTPEGTYIYDYFPLRHPKERLPTYEKRCAEAPLVKIAFACDKFFSTRTAPVETINDEMAQGIQVATKTDVNAENDTIAMPLTSSSLSSRQTTTPGLSNAVIGKTGLHNCALFKWRWKQRSFYRDANNVVYDIKSCTPIGNVEMREAVIFKSGFSLRTNGIVEYVSAGHDFDDNDEDSETTVTVKKLVWTDGKTYLEDECHNIYDLKSHDLIGKRNVKKNTIRWADYNLSSESNTTTTHSSYDGEIEEDSDEN